MKYFNPTDKKQMKIIEKEKSLKKAYEEAQLKNHKDAGKRHKRWQNYLREHSDVLLASEL